MNFSQKTKFLKFVINKIFTYNKSLFCCFLLVLKSLRKFFLKEIYEMTRPKMHKMECTWFKFLPLLL